MINEYLDEILLISKCGSFSKAADQLGITQPALSFRVKKMEEEFGAKIFNRTSDKSLTEEGEVIVAYIKQRKQLELELKNRLDDLQQNLCGSLVVGSTHGFALGYLPYCVQRYVEKYPGVDIQLMEGAMPEIEQAAREGKIDIFITGVEFEDTDFEKEHLFTEDIFICIPPQLAENPKWENHLITREMLERCPIGQNAALPSSEISMLLGETFILLPEEFNVGRVARSILSSMDKEINVRVMETNQMTTSVALSKRGLGVSFVTEDYVRYADFMEFPYLLKVNSDISRRTVYAAYAKKRYLSKAAQAFLSMIKE